MAADKCWVFKILTSPEIGLVPYFLIHGTILLKIAKGKSYLQDKPDVSEGAKNTLAQYYYYYYY